MRTEKDVALDDKRLADIRFRSVPNTDLSRECFVLEKLFDGGVKTALILTAMGRSWGNAAEGYLSELEL